MNVLVFSSLYPNNVWRNHGVFIKERMTEVAKQHDYRVVVVAPIPYYPRVNFGWRSAYAQVVKQEQIEGIQVFHPRYFMIPKIGMFLHGLLMCISVWPTVRTIQRKFQFDLIDAHYVYPDGFAAILLGHLFRKPVVVCARGSDINLFARFPIIRRLLVYVLLRASHVITVSGALKKAIVRLGISEDKISVIPNGVDGNKFRRIDKLEARRNLGLPVNRPMLLSVGGLTEVKGFDLLIRSFKILFDESESASPFLVIIGEGHSRKKLQDIISALGLNSHVTLVGAVPHEELYHWYSAADVFCLASEREGWPNVILEALACGTPVVGAAVGGIPEIIVNDDIGLLTGRESAVMASRIREALQKNWDSDRIIRYAAGYSWHAVGTRVRNVFDTVLSSSGSRDQKLLNEAGRV